MKLLHALIPAAVALAGCSTILGDFQVSANDADASLGDGGAGSEASADALVSPDTATDAPREACVPETNAALCAKAGKNCEGIVATDTCGVARAIPTCGTCTTPQTCGAQMPNVCGCVVESDTQFCSRLGKNCGPVTAMDNCGTTRTVASCGAMCTSPQTCGAHVPNVCGDPVCVPETDGRFCARYGKNCNAFTNIDNCGVNRTASCGACASPQTCGAVTPNVCGCIPESDSGFCARLGLTCGTQTGTDNCGAARSGVTCGACAGGNSCSNGTCACNGAAACSGGLTCCANGCVDTNNNLSGTNCGSCGRTCAPGNYWTCSSGSCTCTQTVSGGMCAGACVSLRGSPNCGQCGVTCTGGNECCLATLQSPYACAPAGSGIICYP